MSDYAALNRPTEASWEFPPRRRRRADAQGTTRGCMRSQNRVQGLSRAKRPSAQWCVSPGWEFGPDRNRRLDTGGAAQSATPYGRLKFSPRSRPNCLRQGNFRGLLFHGSAGFQPAMGRTLVGSVSRPLRRWRSPAAPSRVASLTTALRRAASARSRGLRPTLGLRGLPQGSPRRSVRRSSEPRYESGAHRRRA